MAEHQHLSSALGVGARANQAQLGVEPGKRVGEAKEHGPDHAWVGPSWLAEGPASASREFKIEGRI